MNQGSIYLAALMMLILQCFDHVTIPACFTCWIKLLRIKCSDILMPGNQPMNWSQSQTPRSRFHPQALLIDGSNIGFGLRFKALNCSKIKELRSFVVSGWVGKGSELTIIYCIHPLPFFVNMSNTFQWTLNHFVIGFTEQYGAEFWRKKIFVSFFPL